MLVRRSEFRFLSPRQVYEICQTTSGGSWQPRDSCVLNLQAIASAILDRLLHHAMVFDIRGCFHLPT